MSKEIFNIKLIDFMPNYLKKNKEIVGICEGLEEVLKQILIKSSKLNLYKNLLEGKLSKEELELLMWEHHVDYFDTDLSEKQLKKLILNSMLVHEKKGTRFAVEEILKTVFNDFEIREWFEYGGEPGTFIMLVRELPDFKKLSLIEKIIDNYKKTGAHLDPSIGIIYKSFLYLFQKYTTGFSNLVLTGTIGTPGKELTNTKGLRIKNVLESSIKNFNSEKHKTIEYTTKNDTGIYRNFILANKNNSYISKIIRICSEKTVVRG